MWLILLGALFGFDQTAPSEHGNQVQEGNNSEEV